LTGLLRTFPLTLGLASLVAVCPASTARRAVVVSDDGGRSLHLTEPARRIVSLNPSTTELLFAIGAGGLVVGRTRWCDWPRGALRVPSVGDGFPPNVEAVLARLPDLAVAYPTGANDPPLRQLRELGVPVLVLRTDRLEDLARAARVLGAVTGRAHAGDSLAAAIEAALAARRLTPAEETRGHRVAIVAWDAPPLVIGTGYLHQVVELAGTHNVFADVARASAPVSLEAIAARDPDLILAVGDIRTTLLRRPEWRAVRAVREGLVLPLSDPALARPTPRALTAVVPLRARLARIALSSSLEIAR
jgi:iron complex transport system substrate-binding protein